LKSLVSRKVNQSGFYWSKRWWGGSGISWTICKSFAPRSRQITMPDKLSTGSQTSDDNEATDARCGDVNRRRLSAGRDVLSLLTSDSDKTPSEQDSLSVCRPSSSVTSMFSFTSERRLRAIDDDLVTASALHRAATHVSSQQPYCSPTHSQLLYNTATFK